MLASGHSKDTACIWTHGAKQSATPDTWVALNTSTRTDKIHPLRQTQPPPTSTTTTNTALDTYPHVSPILLHPPLTHLSLQAYGKKTSFPRTFPRGRILVPRFQACTPRHLGRRGAPLRRQDPGALAGLGRGCCVPMSAPGARGCTKQGRV